MSKKVISAIISVIFLGIAGYFFYQNASGNTDLMLSYLEETNYLTDEYNILLMEEAAVETDEELVAFTEEVLIPSLENIVAATKQYGETIENDKLKDVHHLHVQAMELRLEADQEWIGGSDADELFEESDQLFQEYEKRLNNLARQWGVEIEWEEVEFEQ